MKKRIVILDHEGGGRLANQLWNFTSLYAYSLEKNYVLENYSFFRYTKFFNIATPKNSLIRFFFFDFLYKQHWYRMLGPYEKFTTLMQTINKSKILVDDRVNPFYLPPSKPINQKQEELIQWIDNNSSETVYTSGWLFRNPIGLQKYRKEIIEYFKPKNSILVKIDSLLSPLRLRYKHIIGVHIRQTDYKKWHNGKYFFEQSEIKQILNEYLIDSNKKIDETVFVICSDGEINQPIFSGLNIVLPEGNEAEDLFTLSKTDIIIGSNSTYGAWASYYGDIPFVVFERNGIDWEYYRDKQRYFENKKNTLTHY